MRRTEWELLCLPPRDVKGKKWLLWLRLCVTEL